MTPNNCSSEAGVGEYVRPLTFFRQVKRRSEDLLFTWLGRRDSVTFRDPATSLLTINRHRKIALKLPLAVFAPSCSLGDSNPTVSNYRNNLRSKDLRLFLWLGLRFVDITFDEADIECDVAEIRKLLDEENEEASC